MKSYLKRLLCSTILCAGFASAGHASTIGSYIPEVAVGPVVGTMGYGVQVSTPIIKKYLNLNAGVTTFGFNDNVTVDGTRYHGKLNIGGVPIFLSLFPFGGAFHLDAGVYLNNNRLTVNGSPADGSSITYDGHTYSTGQSYTINGHTYSASGSYNIGGHTYSAATIGTLYGATHFNQVAPYVGVGFSDPFRGGPLTFTASLGAMFMGSPNIKLIPGNIDAAKIAGATAVINNEQHKLNKIASDVSIYPVLQFGAVYRF